MALPSGLTRRRSRFTRIHPGPGPSPGTLCGAFWKRGACAPGCTGPGRRSYPGPHSEAGRLIQAKELDRLQALPAAYRTEVQRWLDMALDFCVQARCALENRQKGAPVRAVLQPLCRYLTRKEDVMKEEAEQLLLLLAE